MNSLLFGTAKINEKKHLEIGGCDTLQLAKEYGTPLYVYDVALIRERAQGFNETFTDLGVKHRVTYASKAFSCLAIYQVMKEEGLSCDVVSAGELYTALKAGMDPAQIAFHGNNKTYEELALAVDENIGAIIVDNFYEITLLKEILENKNKTQTILLRVAPGIDAHTHEFIMTGQEDSKFGFDINSGQAERALQIVQGESHFDLVGVHCHIGSQIFSTDAFKMASSKMVELLVDWRKRYDFVAQILNLGGGFGVKYIESDDPLEGKEYVREIALSVKNNCAENEYPLPEIWIEPGRSIVAEAGTSLYTVGARKDIPTVRNYVSVDGGMGENIRTALYDAEYTAAIANDMTAPNEEIVTITGKYCESGDVLVKNASMPKVKPGDILAMFSTGAYGYSMASNYNRNPRPAVVFVENGHSRLVVKRETYADLVSADVPLY